MNMNGCGIHPAEAGHFCNQPGGAVFGRRKRRGRCARFSFAPFFYNVKAVFQKSCLAGLALNLAAGGFWNRAAANENDGPGSKLMDFSNVLANEPEGVVQIMISTDCGFLHEDEPLFALHIYGESCATAGTQYRVALLGGQFNVLRIMVLTTDDEQVFEHSGNEQLAVVNEPQIAGAEEVPIIASSHERLQRFPGLLRSV